MEFNATGFEDGVGVGLSVEFLLSERNKDASRVDLHRSSHLPGVERSHGMKVSGITLGVYGQRDLHETCFWAHGAQQSPLSIV